MPMVTAMGKARRPKLTTHLNMAKNGRLEDEEGGEKKERIQGLDFVPLLTDVRKQISCFQI